MAAQRWPAFAAATSILPFGAILAGRNRLGLRELGWWRPLLAVVPWEGADRWAWFARLRDRNARVRIMARIDEDDAGGSLMALKTTRWDSAQHLGTEEARASYLDACLEEAGDDAGFVAHALGVVARSRNMSQLARDTGLTREGLYKALSEEGNPSFGTVLKVMGALGYRFAVVREVREGYTTKAASKPATLKARGSRGAAGPQRASRRSGSRASR